MSVCTDQFCMKEDLGFDLVLSHRDDSKILRDDQAFLQSVDITSFSSANAVTKKFGFRDQASSRRNLPKTFYVL